MKAERENKSTLNKLNVVLEIDLIRKLTKYNQYQTIMSL